jgi:Na+-transporting methylmalonyl-CoA/oxaloacetate decarboxylase gamma subunit
VKRRLAAWLGFGLGFVLVVLIVLVMLVSLVGAAVASGASGQGANGPEAAEGAGEAGKPSALDHSGVRFKLESRFVPAGDFGSFSADLYRPATKLEVRFPVARNAILSLAGSAHADVYDFDGTSDLFKTGPTAGDPFERLNATTVRLRGFYVFEPSRTFFAERELWALVGEGFWRGRWEEGSDISDGNNAGAMLAAAYGLPGRFQLALGFKLSSKLLGSGVRASPVAHLDWRISDRWRLRNYGAGLRVDYRVTPDVVLFARSRFKSRRFRLDDRGGGIGKGSVRSRQVPAGIGVRWDALDSLRVTVLAGVMAYHQLRIEDEDENTLGTATADPAAFFQLRFDLRR